MKVGICGNGDGDRERKRDGEIQKRIPSGEESYTSRMIMTREPFLLLSLHSCCQIKNNAEYTVHVVYDA